MKLNTSSLIHVTTSSSWFLTMNQSLTSREELSKLETPLTFLPNSTIIWFIRRYVIFLLMMILPFNQEMSFKSLMIWLTFSIKISNVGNPSASSKTQNHKSCTFRNPSYLMWSYTKWSQKSLRTATQSKMSTRSKKSSKTFKLTNIWSKSNSSWRNQKFPQSRILQSDKSIERLEKRFVTSTTKHHKLSKVRDQKTWRGIDPIRPVKFATMIMMNPSRNTLFRLLSRMLIFSRISMKLDRALESLDYHLKREETTAWLMTLMESKEKLRLSTFLKANNLDYWVMSYQKTTSTACSYLLFTTQTKTLTTSTTKMKPWSREATSSLEKVRLKWSRSTIAMVIRKYSETTTMW